MIREFGCLCGRLFWICDAHSAPSRPRKTERDGFAKFVGCKAESRCKKINGNSYFPLVRERIFARLSLACVRGTAAYNPAVLIAVEPCAVLWLRGTRDGERPEWRSLSESLHAGVIEFPRMVPQRLCGGLDLVAGYVRDDADDDLDVPPQDVHRSLRIS